MGISDLSIATVSTQLPLRCGIATYSADLCSTIQASKHLLYALHYGEGEWSHCAGDANCNSPWELVSLAKLINRSGAQVVNLQHEFGIWGGKDGKNIFEFLATLRLPVVCTFHTTFDSAHPNPRRSQILARIAERSSAIVVLTPDSKRYVKTIVPDAESRIVGIPHGIPNVDYQSPPGECVNTKGLRLASIGYLRRDKGFEKVIRALGKLKATGAKFQYVIAGGPQPQFASQVSYADRLRRLVDNLGLSNDISFQTGYLSLAEQIEVIRSAHACLFMYQTPFHSSSGAIPLALACGRVVICTPIAYAREKLVEIGDSVHLTGGFDVKHIVGALVNVLEHSDRLQLLGQTAWEKTRSWVWPRVGEVYSSVFNDAAGRSQ